LHQDAKNARSTTPTCIFCVNFSFPSPRPPFFTNRFRIDFYQKYIYIYVSVYAFTPFHPSYFSFTASIAHPTLESYVRIFERSRNSWWFGYGVVRSSLSAVEINRIDILSPSLNSSSTIARDFYADNRIVVGSKGNFDRAFLPHFPPRSSSLILRLELSTLTRLFNGDQSQTIALCYYLGVDLRNVVLQKSCVYKIFSIKSLGWKDYVSRVLFSAVASYFSLYTRRDALSSIDERNCLR